MECEHKGTWLSQDTELFKSIGNMTIADIAGIAQRAGELIEEKSGHSRLAELSKLQEQLVNTTHSAITDSSQNMTEVVMLLGAVSASLSFTFAAQMEHLEFLADLESLD